MSTVWRHAFRRWALAYFGRDRWENHGVESEWVDAYKTGFRAGWRAAQREQMFAKEGIL